MSLQLQRSDSWNAFGDSITASVGQGHWYDPMFASVTTSYTRGPTSATTAPGGATMTIAPGAAVVTVGPNGGGANYGPTIVNKGIIGNKVSDLQARVAADVIALNPSVVFVECGINDLIGTTGIPTFTTNVNNLLSTIKSGLPSARVGWVGLLCYGESYPDTTWNSLINQYNAVIAAACASAGYTYFDVRTPQQAYESVNNTPSPGAIGGIICEDTPGVHPNTAIGIPLMSTAVLANCTLNGTP